MTKKTLKQFLIEDCISKGYGYEDSELFEHFTESTLSIVTPHAFNEVREDEHRWFEVYSAIKVATIDGEERFFKFQFYNMTGDGCASDMGLEEFSLEDVYEVFAKEVTTIIYK